MNAEPIIEAMRKYFGEDLSRTAHVIAVLRWAEKILEKEGGSEFVVRAAAALHDIGIHEAERKHNSSAGIYQEIEGPPIARKILKDFGASDKDVEHICKIVANHHSAKDIDTKEFRIIWDSDWIVNLPDEFDLSDKEHIKKMILNIFKTETGKNIAMELFLKV
jgi:HD superfamily phosphodiesterase